MTTLSATRGGWNWLADPRAIHHAGRTWVGSIGGDGIPVVTEYVHATRRATTTALTGGVFEVDDHDYPALLRRSSDGRLLAVWTKHVGAVWAAISTNPDDATAWGPAADITSQIGSIGTGQGYTYARLHERSDGIYLFLRWHGSSPAPPGDVFMSFTTSSDDGATWTAREDVLQDCAYFKVAQSGDRLDFGISPHPTWASGDNVRHMYLDAAGVFRQSDGSAISGSLPFVDTAPTLVYSQAPALVWIYDIAPGPVIVFNTFLAYPNDRHYAYARWSGSAWEVNADISDAGGGISSSGWAGNPDNAYVGGIALDHADPTTAYLSRPVSGQWEIFRYRTSDGGTTWGVQQVTSSSSSKQLRPVSVRNGVAAMPVVWLGGRFDTYVDYEQSLEAQIQAAPSSVSGGVSPAWPSLKP